MLLLVVLAILALLALIAASLAYRMDAERMGIESLGNLQQARLAAESGLARTLLLLRDNRTDMDKWYNNPESFRRVPVWMPSDQKEGMGGTESPISKEVVQNQPAWRYSVVSYDQLNEDRVVMRYGLTDEAGKLNINFATRGELLRLVKTLDLKDTPPEALVDALIDWRDQDSTLNSPAGAETPWYMTLSPSYRAKNRPFESLDELLMVKNWNGQFLYGEDYNRNGYLDENEDDGEDGAFPPDDADGQLERGLARLITVHSWDWNFANDNKPRDDINSLKWDQPDKLPQHIQDELGPELIDFLAEAKKRGFKFRSVGELWGLQVYEDGSSNYDDAWDQYREQVKQENALPQPESQPGEDEQDGGQGDENQNGDNQNGENQNGDGSGQDGNNGQDGKNGDKNDGSDENAGDNQGKDGGEAENNDSSPNDQNPDESSVRDRKKPKNQQAIRSETGGSRTGGRGRTGGRTDASNDKDRQGGRGGTRGNDRGGDTRAGDSRNGGTRDSGARDGSRTGGRDSGSRTGGGRTGGSRGGSNGDNGTGNTGNRDGGRDQDGGASQGPDDQDNDVDGGQGRGGRDRGRNGGRGRGGNRTGEGDGAGDSGENGGRGGRPGNGGQPGSGGRTGEGDNTGEGGDSTSQPGEGGDDEAKKGTPVVSPVTPEQMNVVMDRLTTVKSAVRVGQINVDTAEPEVLQSLIGMTPEEAKAIVQARRSLAGPDKTTPAWLVTSGTLEPAKFAVLSNKLTARSIQFTADVIGFADHVGTYRRIQAIIEMRGHMAQIRYYRDISSLGIGYPVKDDERSDGLAFGNQ